MVEDHGPDNCVCKLFFCLILLLVSLEPAMVIAVHAIGSYIGYTLLYENGDEAASIYED